ncbi:phage scaffolding protein, partial [Clostridium perfringens]|uniref:phage scaffolding protein n=1 Tax=Clostridium perfringens TaxID=1502 RepID=UPI0018E4BE75
MERFKQFLIKQGLTEEQANGIVKGMGIEKLYISENENIDERYSKLKAKKEDLEGQIKTANTTIADLKKNHADNETLQQTIKDHEATIKTQREDFEAKIRNMTLDTAINNWLANNKAKHSELLADRFDRDKLVIKESGEVEGLEEQGNGLKETF